MTPQTQIRLALSRVKETVTDLQRLLAQHGYSPGEIDGKWGPNTAFAVHRFEAQLVQDDTKEQISEGHREELAGMQARGALEPLFHAIGTLDLTFEQKQMIEGPMVMAINNVTSIIMTYEPVQPQGE